ncbi:MAG: hypothetical protein ACHRXM_32470 [Isosphaerales bacterium]
MSFRSAGPARATAPPAAPWRKAPRPGATRRAVTAAGADARTRMARALSELGQDGLANEPRGTDRGTCVDLGRLGRLY